MAPMQSRKHGTVFHIHNKITKLSNAQCLKSEHFTCQISKLKSVILPYDLPHNPRIKTEGTQYVVCLTYRDAS